VLQPGQEERSGRQETFQERRPDEAICRATAILRQEIRPIYARTGLQIRSILRRHLGKNCQAFPSKTNQQ